jgi:hypothetical protein
METPPGSSRFPAETLEQLVGAAARDQFRPQDLDRHQAIDYRIMSTIHLAHRAKAEQLLDPVATDRLHGPHFGQSVR